MMIKGVRPPQSLHILCEVKIDSHESDNAELGNNYNFDHDMEKYMLKAVDFFADDKAGGGSVVAGSLRWNGSCTLAFDTLIFGNQYYNPIELFDMFQNYIGEIDDAEIEIKMMDDDSEMKCEDGTMNYNVDIDTWVNNAAHCVLDSMPEDSDGSIKVTDWRTDSSNLHYARIKVESQKFTTPVIVSFDDVFKVIDRLRRGCRISDIVDIDLKHPRRWSPKAKSKLISMAMTTAVLA